MTNQIDTIYNYLLRRDSSLHITTNLNLVTKPWWITRCIQKLPLFSCFFKETTEITSVINIVSSHSFRCASSEERQKAQFIVAVLENLKAKRNPYYNVVRPSNPDKEELNNAFIDCVRGVGKQAAATLSSFICPPIGLALYATTIPESHDDIVKIEESLSQGADINYQEKVWGYSPLMYAAYHGYHRIAECLLAHGADPNIRENLGYNAYQMAKYYLDRYSSVHTNAHSIIERYQKTVDLLRPNTHDLTNKTTLFHI